MTDIIAIHGLAHVGIRVHDLDRSLSFYELLGFEKTAGPMGPEPVVVLEHPSGLELNLVLNAKSATPHNILMDVPDKHAGVTHIALLCPDLLAAKARLEAAGFPPSEAASTRTRSTESGDMGLRSGKSFSFGHPARRKLSRCPGWIISSRLAPVPPLRSFRLNPSRPERHRFCA